MEHIKIKAERKQLRLKNKKKSVTWLPIGFHTCTRLNNFKNSPEKKRK